MKTITIQITGTDGEPHGHGGWEMDPEEFEVSDRQYEKIRDAYLKGEYDLEAMKVYGLIGRCREIVNEYRGYAEARGAYMPDVEVNIIVVGIDDDCEE